MDSKVSGSAPVIVADLGCECGENPLWDDHKGCVYWTDIPAGKLYRFDIQPQHVHTIYEGQPVGGFTIQEDGDLLLFRVKDIAVLHSDGTVAPVLDFWDHGMERFNDVIADPAGRVFAGTIGENNNCTGGLYRVDTDGRITRLFLGTSCSNGMGFSPDLKAFYWTCSTAKRIDQFDYDPRSGEITNRRVFYQATEHEGIPDGLTVDSEGCVWSARWNGSCIKRHAMDGTVIESIHFSVPRISSMCFGGKSLNQFYVTSATDPKNRVRFSGALMSVETSANGIPEFRSNISCSIPPTAALV